MRETHFHKQGDNYELFVQVTEYTHYYDVITIIHHEGNWREDRNQYTGIEYQNLEFPKTYQQIQENVFERAQNQILAYTGKTRTELRKFYHDLWFPYLVDRLRIQEWLLETDIDLTNHWLVSQFRQDKERHLDMDKRRQEIHEAFNQNNPAVISNEDIYNKTTADIIERYLERRAKLLENKQK